MPCRDCVVNQSNCWCWRCRALACFNRVTASQIPGTSMLLSPVKHLATQGLDLPAKPIPRDRLEHRKGMACPWVHCSQHFQPLTPHEDEDEG